MKGPGHRSRYDVRRTWECPTCRRQVRTHGSIVHLLCRCGEKETPPRQIWMHLMEKTVLSGAGESDSKTTQPDSPSTGNDDPAPR
jgi:hypothetical protein